MNGYPNQIRHRFGKLELEFRPICPEDEAALERLFLSHSEETVINRYFVPLRQLSAAQKKAFVCVNHSTEEAIVGYRPSQPDRFLCVGRYMETGVEGEGEMAITVHDHYQGRGIGRFLLRFLMKIGCGHGIRHFSAYCLSTNTAMLKLFKSQVILKSKKLEDGVYELHFDAH
jgi:ribosomal protein S18 acetylase RimI-like enzyme